MKFHYAGKYNGSEESLPQREHPANAVPFREPELKQLAIIANVGALVTTALLAIPFYFLGRGHFGITTSIGAICTMLVLVPHEFIHALLFKEDVYMYNNLKQGLLFVAGTEDMSRMQFILMSLAPNIVFGLIPYLIFLCFHQFTGIGFFGLICIGMGFGDYINIYNALTQVPKGAKVYMSGTHSFWYRKEE